MLRAFYLSTIWDEIVSEMVYRSRILFFKIYFAA